MRLVLFDFDGTLTTRDTIRPFASYLCNASGRSGFTRASVDLSLLLLKLHLTSNHTFKQRFLQLLVQGLPAGRVQKWAEQFHATHLESIQNRPVVELLLEHTAAGDDVYLVSSNFDFFLQPLQQRWNLKGILATQTEVLDGCFTGCIVGRACDGREKLTRVVASFGERNAREAVAYGDSRSDCFLLDFVRTGHWVGPSRSVSAARALRPA
jgi:HAD superfamily hydrolase (TIGR01490 family)